MRRYIGTLVLLIAFAACTPFGQRLMIHQIPAWVIRDGGFQSPPDQVVAVGELKGYYFAPQPGQPTIFFAHGNSSRHARQVERLRPDVKVIGLCSQNIDNSWSLSNVEDVETKPITKKMLMRIINKYEL